MRFTVHLVLFTTLHASLSQSHFESTICNMEEARVRIFIFMSIKIHGIMAVCLKLCDFIRPWKLEAFEENRKTQKHLLLFFFLWTNLLAWTLICDWEGCQWLSCSRGQHCTLKMTCHPVRPVTRWVVTSVEIWAVFTQRSAVSWPGIPLWHREDFGLQAQLEEMVWAGSPETWLLILSQMLNSFATGAKVSAPLIIKLGKAQRLLMDFYGDCRNTQNTSSSGKIAVWVAVTVSCM